MTPLRPLEGHVVVDLSQNLPGPLLTRILGDLGARVIKVEPPTGEGLRWLPPHKDGMGVAFAALNAGKQSIAVDLKDPAGVALLRAVIAKADVLVESFRPGVLARLGLAPDALRSDNPGLIVASLTGFGQHTPLGGTAGHDLTFLARSGMLGLQGPPDGPPAVGFAQVADVGGGSYPAAIGVLAAVLERQQTGQGRHLDISLTRSVPAFSPVLLVSALSGQGAPRGRDPLTGAVPCYRCYATADDRYLAVGALEPHFWQNLCAVLGRPDLASKQYSFDPRDHEAVEVLFAERPLAHWVDRFAGVDACVEAVRTPAEAMADPDWDPPLRHAGDHPTIPLHVGAPIPDELPPPPALGADVDAVVDQLGLDPTLLAAARASGAIPTPRES